MQEILRERLTAFALRMTQLFDTGQSLHRFAVRRLRRPRRVILNNVKNLGGGGMKEILRERLTAFTLRMTVWFADGKRGGQAVPYGYKK